MFRPAVVAISAVDPGSGTVPTDDRPPTLKSEEPLKGSYKPRPLFDRIAGIPPRAIVRLGGRPGTGNGHLGM